LALSFRRWIAVPGFSTQYKISSLTRKVGMGCQLLHPRVGDDNAILAFRVLLSLVPMIVGISDDIGHILSFQGCKDAKKELTLWQFV
jgi:hypothetical protein